jgi:hypothetical protein
MKVEQANADVAQFVAEHELCTPPVEISHEAEETDARPCGYTVSVVCTACGVQIQRTSTAAEVRDSLGRLATSHGLTVDELLRVDGRQLDQLLTPDAIKLYLTSQANLKRNG